MLTCVCLGVLCVSSSYGGEYPGEGYMALELFLVGFYCRFLGMSEWKRKCDIVSRDSL